ncbi:hypothetical protein NQZ68_009261 [Dissostichus eleginoides]|nr:hypothetical protein NQZ68_009261 [Dissostichus eleginoides]
MATEQTLVFTGEEEDAVIAAHQLKVSGNISRWKPQINDDNGDILRTRSPSIGKNQRQADGAPMEHRWSTAFPRCGDL